MSLLCSVFKIQNTFWNNPWPTWSDGGGGHCRHLPGGPRASRSVSTDRCRFEPHGTMPTLPALGAVWASGTTQTPANHYSFTMDVVTMPSGTTRRLRCGPTDPQNRPSRVWSPDLPQGDAACYLVVSQATETNTAPPPAPQVAHNYRYRSLPHTIDNSH